MNRTPSTESARVGNACYGKFFCRISTRQLLGVAILVGGWGLVMADLLDMTPTHSGASTQLVQQMVWNPSPK